MGPGEELHRLGSGLRNLGHALPEIGMEILQMEQDPVEDVSGVDQKMVPVETGIVPERRAGDLRVPEGVPVDWNGKDLLSVQEEDIGHLSSTNSGQRGFRG